MVPAADAGCIGAGVAGGDWAGAGVEGGGAAAAVGGAVAKDPPAIRRVLPAVRLAGSVEAAKRDCRDCMLASNMLLVID